MHNENRLPLEGLVVVHGSRCWIHSCCEPGTPCAWMCNWTSTACIWPPFTFTAKINLITTTVFCLFHYVSPSAACRPLPANTYCIVSKLSWLSHVHVHVIEFCYTVKWSSRWITIFLLLFKHCNHLLSAYGNLWISALTQRPLVMVCSGTHVHTITLS